MLVFSTSLFIVSCGEKKQSVDKRTYKYDPKYSFMVDMIGENENSNVIFSPYSLDMCLALIMNGAEGNSLSQIEEFTNTSKHEMNNKAKEQIKYYNNFSKLFLLQQKELNKDKSKITDSYEEYDSNPSAVLVANSIWGNSRLFKFKKEYKKIVKNKLDAQSKTLDFNSSDAIKIVNNWCKKKTFGLIESIIDDKETLKKSGALLLNSLYFKSQWRTPYYGEQVKKEEFHNFDGTKSKVKMMNSYESEYFENDYVTGFIKPYNEYNLKFVGILPKKSGNFYISDLDIDDILDTIKKSKNSNICYEVNTKLPKFEIETDANLKEILKEYGIEDIFDTESADLTKLGKSKYGGKLFVSEIKQKSKMKLDETGTEAASVTSALIGIKSTAKNDKSKIEYREVFLDRPFAFLIYDEKNDNILFEGKIVNFK